MTLAEQITSILRQHLNGDHCIDIPQAETLLRQSGFDLENLDPEGEGLAVILSDLPSSFVVDTSCEPPMLRCLLVADEAQAAKEQPAEELPVTEDEPVAEDTSSAVEEEPVAEEAPCEAESAAENEGDKDSIAPPAEQPAEQLPQYSGEEYAKLNAVIADIIRIQQAEAVKRGLPFDENKLPLTNLGQAMQQRGIAVLPPTKKLRVYLSDFPELFEISGDGDSGRYFIRNIKDGSVETKPQKPSGHVPVVAAQKPKPAVTEPKPVAVKPVTVPVPPAAGRQASPYELQDFAYFENYVEALCQLSTMAKQQGWHLLPTLNNPNPYLLLDYKLRTNFAHSVAAFKQNPATSGLFLRPDCAWFRTGLVNDDNKPIRANFAYNTLRNEGRWQQYVFMSFSLESSNTREGANEESR